MTKKVAFVSMKGGVGKTTVAVNLACALADENTSVALVDADVQATATEWLAIGNLPIAGHAAPIESIREGEHWSESEQSIRRLVDRLLTVEADFEVIDAPPHLLGSTGVAIALCDLVVIPCSASAADVSATAKTLKFVQRARELRGGAPLILMLPNRIDTRSKSGAAIEQVLTMFGEPVGPAISHRVAFADCIGVGKWIGQYARGSAGHREIELLAEVVRKLLRETEDAGEAADIHELTAATQPSVPPVQTTPTQPAPNQRVTNIAGQTEQKLSAFAEQVKENDQRPAKPPSALTFFANRLKLTGSQPTTAEPAPEPAARVGAVAPRVNIRSRFTSPS